MKCYQCGKEKNVLFPTEQKSEIVSERKLNVRCFLVIEALVCSGCQMEFRYKKESE